MNMNNYRKDELINIASDYLVGGVSCGWNSMWNIGPTHFKQANGCELIDVDGKDYIDFSMGWGSLFLGHNHQTVKKSMEEAMSIGFGMQYETEYHIKLAKLFCELVPCAEKVRLTNTGTESTLYAIRLARAYTGREKIIKFEGHFHGVHDYLNFSNDVPKALGRRLEDGEVESLSGSAGIPKGLKDYVITLQYNDIESFCKIADKYKNEIAGVILEPICLASAIMFPQNDFLARLKSECKSRNMVLIFDEVMSGFRDNIGSAQTTLGVTPDLATFSKIMGGGFIISAIAGKKEIMNMLDPVGECVASGTNSGRLLSVIGAYNTINYLKNNQSIYNAHRINCDYFISEINKLLARYSVKGVAKGYGGRISIFIGKEKVGNNYEQIVGNWDREMNNKFFFEAYKRGLYCFMMPLAICPEPICLTPAHTKADIDKTLSIFEEILKLF